MKKLFALVALIGATLVVAAQTNIVNEPLLPDEVKAVEQYRLNRARADLSRAAMRCKDTNALAQATEILQTATPATNAPVITTPPTISTPQQ